MDKTEGRCIIICAGDFTVGQIPLREDDYIIAVDGGLDYCAYLELEPDLVIGDFDSVSDAEKEAIGQLELIAPDKIIRLPKEKDDTDTIAALKVGLDRGYRQFQIYAGTGGRFDHTFANIQCLLFLKHHDACGYLVDGNGMILVIENEAVHFNKTLEGTLSLFSLNQMATGVSITGMKYCLENASITNDFPIGISNEFIGEEGCIAVSNGALVCMISYAE